MKGRSSAAPAAILAAFLSLAASGEAGASAVTEHQVRSGETLALLAAEYYGHRRYAIYLQLENGLKETEIASELSRGSTLSVPVGTRIVTRPGAELTELAEQYLGDAGRAEFLANHNDLGKGEIPAAGRVLDIPFHVAFTANDDEPSLEDIAARYLRDAGRADLLRDYNDLDDDGDTLDEGQTILIPTPHIDQRSARRPDYDDDAESRVRARRKLEAAAFRSLPAATHAWRRGDYDRVLRELGSFDTDYLDAETALEVSVLVGGAHIAFGDSDAAEKAFAHALSRDPHYEISAYEFSPAVRKVWQDLGGGVDTSSR